jgi:hypothetical protein
LNRPILSGVIVSSVAVPDIRLCRCADRRRIPTTYLVPFQSVPGRRRLVFQSAFLCPLGLTFRAPHRQQKHSDNERVESHCAAAFIVNTIARSTSYGSIPFRWYAACLFPPIRLTPIGLSARISARAAAIPHDADQVIAIISALMVPVIPWLRRRRSAVVGPATWYADGYLSTVHRRPNTIYSMLDVGLWSTPLGSSSVSGSPDDSQAS